MLPEPATLLHSSFYRFWPVADPLALAGQVRAMAQGLTGLIVLATEGINGAVAGAPEAVQAFEAALQASGRLSDAARPLRFKHSACRTPPLGA